MPSDILGAHLDKWGPRQEDDFAWVDSLMRTFRYKPGWVFQVNRRPEAGTVMLLIDFHAPDSRDAGHMEPDGRWTGRVAKVGGNYYLDRYLLESRDVNLFWQWLRRILGEVEGHERDEWFRVDGDLPFDPHKGD